MKHSLFTSTLLLGSLVGCATQPGAPYATAPKVPVTVATGPATTPDMPASEVAYALARRAHGQGQLALAAGFYNKVLQTDANHVGALNGLGVIRAQEGRTEEALALFTRTRDLNPKSAHVHNNIGYTLLQAERLPEARVALKEALDLEPGSLQTIQNFRLLFEAERRAKLAAAKVVREQPVVTARGEAAGALVAVAPQIYELRATAPLPTPQAAASAPVAVASAVPVPAPVQVAALVSAAPTVTATVPVMANAPAISTMPETVPTRVAATETTVPTATLTPTTNTTSTTARTTTYTTVATTTTDLRGLRLEVANGVGVERLATRTAGQLAKSGVRVSRLTNQKPYRQVRTQIRYVAGQEAALQALTQHLPVSVERVAVASLPAGMHLKLVLGRDFSGQAIASWFNQPDTQRVTTRPESVVPAS